ncbi:MAG: ABC transporter ATP-binding protein [Propionibacteriales bacterium]|nr:ABC transporter ATP-binding protein [Propionibacteriales bacterium]
MMNTTRRRQNHGRSPTGEQVLEAVDLIKTFQVRGRGRFNAVDGVSFTIHAGEVLALLGPNGAGKTTAIDMMLGLTEPTSGRITSFGTTPRRAVQNGRSSAVLQTGGLLHDMTVNEVIDVIASLHRSSGRAGHVKELAELTRIGKQKISKCSGGEQQRIKFALALLPDPDLLVLDEPTTGMDVNARRAFWDTMKRDAESGRTIIFATHYLEEAQDFAQRIVLISDGQIRANGPTHEVQAMTSGRTVSFTVDADADAVVSSLAQEPGVTAVTRNGNRIQGTTADSDALVVQILGQIGGRDVEVTAPSLENAFVALTGHQAQTGPQASTGNQPESEATTIDADGVR